MESNLELLMSTSTPENFEKIDSINTLFNFYLDSFSDIKEFIEDPINMLDVDYLVKKYEETANINISEIRRELFKIHLQEIFTTFDEIEDSEEIYLKFKSIYEALGIDASNLKIVADLDNAINSEYINSSTLYKTKKGTRAGFFFVYDMINKSGIQAINADGLFRLIEGTPDNPNVPYEYRIETSLYREVFERTIIPLAHPVGFNWLFIRLLAVNFVDYFGLEEISHLQKTTLTCYGLDQKSVSQKEIIESEIYGKLKSFNTSTDQHNNEKVVIDYYPIDGTEGDGLRLVREYNGEVTLYDRQSVKVLHNVDNNEYVGQIQYLEIEDIKLENDTQGNLTINMVDRVLLDEEFEAIGSVDFQEYTLIDKPTVSFLFKLKDDKPDVWYRSTIVLENKEVSDDIRYFEPVNITRQDILDGSLDYNGRIVNDYGLNCRIDYGMTYTYKLLITDIPSNVQEIRQHQMTLPGNVQDIYISQEDLRDAETEGRDPYKHLYNNAEHTFEEKKYIKSVDLWPRLASGAKKPPPYIGQENLDPLMNTGHLAPEIVIDDNTGEVTYIPDGEITDLCIGGDWTLANNSLAYFDYGYNSNSNPPRWEQYYKPTAEEDLALVNSTNTIARYNRDNLECIDIPLSNNNEYVAWEDYNEDVYIEMFKDQDYCINPMSETWYLGEENANIGCLFVDLKAEAIKVDAEVYRSQWNFAPGTIEENKYDKILLESVYSIEDIYDENYVQDNIVLNTLYNLEDTMFENNPITETKSEIIYFEVFKNEEYCYDTLGESWDIGNDSYIGSCLYIGSTSNTITVDAEMYRLQWNSKDGKNDYENLLISLDYSLDDVVEQFIDGEIYSPTYQITDSYDYTGEDHLITDDDEIAFNLGDDVTLGDIKPVIDGDWEFGVYRYNEDTESWELVEDNNVSKAA